MPAFPLVNSLALACLFLPWVLMRSLVPSVILPTLIPREAHPPASTEILYAKTVGEGSLPVERRIGLFVYLCI